MSNLYDLNVVERERVAAKFAVTETLERSCVYGHLGPFRTIAFEHRIQRALKIIPSQHRSSALALFANTVYLPTDFLEGLWRLMGDEIENDYGEYGQDKADIFAKCQFFEVDPEGLLVDFLRANLIEGRLDISSFSRIRDLRHFLDSLSKLARKRPSADEVRELEFILQRKLWVILTDNALSGTSLSSDLRRLLEIRDRLHKSGLPVPQRIIVCAQILTCDARDKIRENFEGTSKYIDLRHGFFFDEKFKVQSPDCRLFADESTRRGVVKLCKWFHKEIIERDESLLETLKLSGGDLTFGFKSGGFTFVSHKNSHTNSIPLIWYAPHGWHSQSKYQGSPLPGDSFYVGPYPRLHSRLKQQKGYDEARLQAVCKSWKTISSHLLSAKK